MPHRGTPYRVISTLHHLCHSQRLGDVACLETSLVPQGHTATVILTASPYPPWVNRAFSVHDMRIGSCRHRPHVSSVRIINLSIPRRVP